MWLGRIQTTIQTPAKFIFWKIPYQRGELVVKGYRDGELVTDTLRSSGQATQIQVQLYKSKLQKTENEAD
ncbi:DUF4982 domain-containing protein [Pedobacter sp. UYEF25]